MNILMVNKFLGPRGGAERCMLTSGSLLAARGHRVSYFGMEDAGNVVGNESGLYARHRDFHRRGLRGLVNPAALPPILAGCPCEDEKDHRGLSPRRGAPAQHSFSS